MRARPTENRHACVGTQITFLDSTAVSIFFGAKKWLLAWKQVRADRKNVEAWMYTDVYNRNHAGTTVLPPLQKTWKSQGLTFLRQTATEPLRVKVDSEQLQRYYTEYAAQHHSMLDLEESLADMATRPRAHRTSRKKEVTVQLDTGPVRMDVGTLAELARAFVWDVGAPQWTENAEKKLAEIKQLLTEKGGGVEERRCCGGGGGGD